MSGEVAEQFAPAIAVIGIFAALAFMFWVAARRREIQARLRTEWQNRFLERFGSGAELASFLQTEDGKRFLQPLMKETTASPVRAVFPSIQIGVVLMVFGLAFFPIAYLVSEVRVFIPGLLFLFGGLGFLASGFIARLLAKKWGLLKSE